MKRTIVASALAAALAALLAGCSPAPATPAGEGGSTTPTGSVEVTSSSQIPSKMIGTAKKTKVFLHVTRKYDPADYPKAKMDGEPSDIKFFRPVDPDTDEGVKRRDYPDFDSKTFKFLALPAGTLPPQSYYMFDKDGGTLNKALKAKGYKAAEIVDQGHIKILPNMYLGYYDFAWVPLNILTEVWSGNESMNQELWRDGNDYVIVGAAWNGGISLITSGSVNSVDQLADTTVGIMNPSFNIEALFQKKLKSVGLATAASGGTVNIQTGSPGIVMNNLMSKKLSAVFAWGTYGPQLQKQFGYRELVNWTQMGYGKNVPYDVLIVRRDIIEKHPDIVQTVVQLNYDATQQALKKGDYKQPLGKKYEQFKSEYLGQPPTKTPPQLLDFTADANPVFLKDVVNYMTECGYFKKPYTYDQLVDRSFYEKVKK
jgi:ABC-type nitrate/sulfonate/bicarbonate transport system substrate-binding protein